MTKYFIIIITFCSILSARGQTTKDNLTVGLTIDPNIKTEVEKNITISEFGARQDKILIYNNRMLLDFYEDDKLSSSLKEQDNKSTVFKSFYYWQGDTLGIDGAFGLFGGTGFSIKMVKGKATLYHMLASDNFPSYAYNQKDSLIFRLEVPCTDTKIILSEIPDATKNKVIYGYVEFKSGDYYSSSSAANGQEILPRKKHRANMKIYFKSAYVDIK
ncbi:hypothetical protein D7322_13725 [Sphingobacterium puteale]|uniref:Uncharacterized protein n=1 Tax=Sphingobacterium puteale TaxID=2420510 RepID=A0A420VYD5_9SPHI|nr:hypothetical protein [Sphingobacterium puteale]RKO71207.1 hypothetical protein D7322_13725 [Sphingobacterium puteale]